MGEVIEHILGNEVQIIEAGQKIAQLVMTPVIHFRALETNGTLYDWYPITISKRGAGALGSTDATTEKRKLSEQMSLGFKWTDAFSSPQE